MEHKDSRNDQDKRTVVGELNLSEVGGTIRRDFKELKEFFLDQERLARLEQMGKFKRSLYSGFWLLKGLFLNLTFVRRLLLLLALFLLFINVSGTIGIGSGSIRVDNNFKLLAGIVLLFILMLELKDKLLAKDELAAGRRVQLALLPKEDPNIPGWEAWIYSRPANDVGGDLVDFMKIDDDRFGLALGDVAGKGLPAALVMAKLQATLRALVTEFDSLALMGAKINRIFHRDIVSRSFASLVYMELGAHSGHIEFLNAGHPPPLVIKEGQVHATQKGDLGLGIRPQTQFVKREVDIHDGNYFIVYSDGVTEAQDEAEEFFGFERFAKLLTGAGDASSAELGQKILAAVDRFVGGAPRQDDLSLLVLKKK